MVGNSCREFFKVYLSQISSKQLGLPPAFVSNLGGKIRKKCTIKDSDGKIWKVKLEGVRAGLVVANGWEEFVNHHSLVDGDFLVFDYDGDSHFGVKIYGMNGLRKRKAVDAFASTSSVKKGKQQGVEEMSNSLPLRPNVVSERRNSEVPRKRTSTCPGHDHSGVKLNQCRQHVRPPKVEKAASNFASSYPNFKAVVSRQSNLSVPGMFVKIHIKPKMEHTKQLIKKFPETILVVANGKWTVTLIIYLKYCCYGKLSAGWTRFVRDNCLEVGDECFFELINNDPVIMKVSIFKHNGYEHPADFVPPKAEEAIITSSYPYFKALMCSGHLGSNMFVPSKFVMNHIKPKMEQAKQRVKVIETQLLVGDNKWSVRLNVYFYYRGRGQLSVGWRKFVRDNCMEVGDECLFELINNNPVTMKVSIFKHISE